MVDVASTNQQRYQGLSGKPVLPDNVGMLFVYRQPKVLDFCMRGCPIPIDIAFIGADMRVDKTYQMKPEPPDWVGSEDYCSDQPAQYALEVAGGVLEQAGVKQGDHVLFLGPLGDAAK